MAKLRPISDVVEETLKYIKARKDGTIKSLRTGFKKLDGCMLDGIEWNSTITIGGRPSVGKSAFSDCLVEGAFANNLARILINKGMSDERVEEKPDFILLDFNWELSSKVMLLRRMSASMKKTYKYIISAAGNTITDEEMEEMAQIMADKYNNLPIFFEEEPLSAKEFADTVKRFCEQHKGKNILVRVDHTLLTKRSASEASQVEMLLNLLMEANILKKQYPVIFMFLTQINRDIEERQEDGTDRAYPRQGDVYGGDASAMFSETILLLNKPSKYGINYYGNRGTGIMVEQDDIFAHMVKNRNAEGDLILHYKENFKHMSIKEY
jgi:replicative DNA helicase